MNWENNLKQIVEGAILASESPLVTRQLDVSI